jgi:hypothetical protein
VKAALRGENVRDWHEVEHDFLESEYRAVRDRQMKELELEDDLLSKLPIRYVELVAHFRSVHSITLGTSVQHCTRSHMNLFDSNGYNVYSKVLGLSTRFL